MRGSDLVTWGLLIWIGARIFGSAEENTQAQQAQAGACSYGFGANMQSNIVIPYWIRQMSQKDVKPFYFESE